MKDQDETAVTPDAPPTVQITVLLFSVLRDRIGQRQLRVELPVESRASDLVDHLCRQYPDVAAHRTSLRLAINADYAQPDQLLTEGDEVALITPVSGG